MSNGRPWLATDTATLEQMAGRPDREIAEATGHPVRTVREYRQARGIKAHVGRAHWTRRDWLLADASGLDFQMSVCRI